MKELREHNENMLRNILPSHVARHFLEKDRDNEVCTFLNVFPPVKLHDSVVRFQSRFTSSVVGGGVACDMFSSDDV